MGLPVPLQAEFCLVLAYTGLAHAVKISEFICATVLFCLEKVSLKIPPPLAPTVSAPFHEDP